MFIHYEEMKTDFAAVLECVASFLDYDDLTADQKQCIAKKCSFKYMQDNEELFEMSPRNMFSVGDARLWASGKEARYNDVISAIRQRILDYCRQSLRGSDYPAHHFYPDLVIPIMSEDETTQRFALEPSRT